MIKLSFLRCVVLGTVLLGCSEKVQQRFVADDGFSEDPLDYTDVSRTLLTEQNYFVAYSQSSGRLGIVDADSYSEIWGTYTTKDVPFVFNLPGHEGAGLVSPGKFEVVIKEGTRQFAFPFGPTASWSRAKTAIMVTAFDSEAKSLAIVKFRGENVWETSTFTPFVGSSESLEKSVVIAGKDGKMAVLIDPTSGSYVSFNEAGDKFSAGPDCLNSDPLVDGPVKSLAIDETSGHAFAAIGSKIFQFAITTSSSCVTSSSWTLVYTGDPVVNRIGTLDDGKFYAILASGQIEIFSSVNGALVKDRTLLDFCGEPLSVNNFGADNLALTCAIRFSGGEETISNAQLVVVNASNEKTFTRAIFFEKKSSVVFYPGKSQYFELYDSAAGEVDVHTVPSGEVSQLRGLFIGDILNKL